MKILAIRTSALGDSILATPTLEAVRDRYPQAALHFVTSAPLAPLFDGLPFLSRVWPWTMGGGRRTIAGVPAFAERLLEAGPFDLVIDLQNSISTRLLVARLNPSRILRFVKRKGVRAVVSSIFGEGPILDEVHASTHFFETVEPLGITRGDGEPSLHVQLRQEARALADRLLAEAKEAPVVALAPGARWPVKRWDPIRFAAVGDALAAAGAKLILLGGPGDREAIEATRAALGEAPLADTVDLDLPALAAVLERSALLVSCDSGPSHLAQAVGTPVVAVFGPTSIRRWGPLPGRGVAINLPLACSPCTNFGRRPCPLGHHACMVDLQPQPVIEASVAALGAGREGGAAAAAEVGRSDRVDLALQVARSGREVRR